MARHKTHGSIMQVLQFGPFPCFEPCLHWRSVTIAHGGVLPKIHTVLLPKNSKKSPKKPITESEEF